MGKRTSARDWMIATAQHLATRCGAVILSKGGNVIDAAIATSAALCVAENNSCGLGGDSFVLFKLDGKIREINGSGRAARAATTELYEKANLKAIPSMGPLSCITVPGLVSAWGELLKYATMDLAELLAPSIEYAENGVPLTGKYLESIEASVVTLGQFDGWKELFMPRGLSPERDFILNQKDLATSLKMIAREGVGTFYDGHLADKIVSGIREAGGLLDSEDFRRHTATVAEPISTVYRGTRIYETSPNSQAATVLLWLNMLEDFDLERIASDKSKLQRLLITTCLKAYEQRARFIADPAFFTLPPSFLSKEFARSIFNASLQGQRNSRSTVKGDTTYFAVGDRDGNTVSMIQSNYMGFGSGVVPKGTGFVLQNRGCYFSLDRSHHNALAPGKRTFHTLCASLGEKDGKTLFSLGTMGGDIQPQIHVQLMTKLVDLGWELQEAVDSPRWFIPATIYEDQTTIFFEKGLDTLKSVPTYLKTVRIDELTSLAGHANAVYFSNEGLVGASDPRCDGSAIGT